MLCKVSELKGYTLDSLNGKIGEAKEFYFDDRHWTIRYLVADTGNWLMDRQVLISPYALVEVNREEQVIAVNLSKQQILESPPLDSDKPVSRQFEMDYHGYYEWPMYSDGPYIWGASPYILRDLENRRESTEGEKSCDSHLRSTHEVSGYHLQALDGEVGHVEDFIIDDETWTIRYLIVDTRNWWPGKKVLISPQWIERVSWDESKVFVHIPADAIKEAPEYTDKIMLTRDYETILHIHYNRKMYWKDISGDR
ncbi:MAG: PRC-barrel domain-containing protein [Desulfuromonadaceae bacterium]|nr:PRC-barrel domain-containing protein [Desulfuromonadaceae bacterium]MDD2848290.1 PRC-barrel domain-containing protein [Desulfuromonadaceae bacterium]MDD4129314.1 PRC-barrel domain-containing protein [Desulfuromonadaceae bacterium]